MGKVNGAAQPSLAKFNASRAKYVHVSAEIVHNPMKAKFVVQKGRTFNKGRNAAKRAKKDLISVRGF
jgi:hypothetical protein